MLLGFDAFKGFQTPQPEDPPLLRLNTPAKHIVACLFQETGLLRLCTRIYVLIAVGHPFWQTGVLVTERGDQRAGYHRPRREFTARPNVGEIVRLLPRYRLGVFSSATKVTVDRGLEQVLEAVWQAHGKTKAPGFVCPRTVMELFPIVYHRAQTLPNREVGQHSRPAMEGVNIQEVVFSARGADLLYARGGCRMHAMYTWCLVPMKDQSVQK